MDPSAGTDLRASNASIHVRTVRTGLWILPSALTGAVDLLDRGRETKSLKAFLRPMFVFSDVTFSGWPTAIWLGLLVGRLWRFVLRQAWLPVRRYAASLVPHACRGPLSCLQLLGSTRSGMLPPGSCRPLPSPWPGPWQDRGQRR